MNTAAAKYENATALPISMRSLVCNSSASWVQNSGSGSCALFLSEYKTGAEPLNPGPRNTVLGPKSMPSRSCRRIRPGHARTVVHVQQEDPETETY